MNYLQYVFLDQDDIIPGIRDKAFKIIEIYRSIEDICEGERTASIPLYIPYTINVETYAESIRRYIGITWHISLNYFDMLENLNFRTITLPMPKLIESFVCHDEENSNAFFFVNSKLDHEQQTYKLMYEFGKLLLFQQEKIFDGNPDNFATAFLIPSQAVFNIVKQCGVQKDTWSYELLINVKRRFQVSTELFLRRLHSLDLIESSIVETFMEKKDEKQDRRISIYGKYNSRLKDLIAFGREKNIEKVRELENELEILIQEK